MSVPNGKDKDQNQNKKEIMTKKKIKLSEEQLAGLVELNMDELIGTEAIDKPIYGMNTTVSGQAPYNLEENNMNEILGKQHPWLRSPKWDRPDQWYDSNVTAGCDSDDDCGEGECCYTAACLDCKDVPGKKSMREGNLNINDEPDVEQYIGLEEAKESDCPGHECSDGDSCAEHNDMNCGNHECVNGCCTAMCDNKTKTPGSKGNNSVMKSIKEEIMKIKRYKRLINEWINHPCEDDPVGLACHDCCNTTGEEDCCKAANAMHTLGPIDGPGSGEIGIDNYDLEDEEIGTGKYTWEDCCNDYKKGKGRGHKECCDKLENEGGRQREKAGGRSDFGKNKQSKDSQVKRLSEAAMCYSDNDCQAGEYCNTNGGDLGQGGSGRCRKGRGGMSMSGGRRLNEAPYCPGGCGECECVHHGKFGRCDCDGMMDNWWGNDWGKVADDGGGDDIKMAKQKELREFHEYSKNRTNIERFLNEKEDKEMGTPDPKKVMDIAKKVLTGGNPPSTGMSNWWCCLIACNNPGCKGDRWEVVMNPWG